MNNGIMVLSHISNAGPFRVRLILIVSHTTDSVQLSDDSCTGAREPPKNDVHKIISKV